MGKNPLILLPTLTYDQPAFQRAMTTTVSATQQLYQGGAPPLWEAPSPTTCSTCPWMFCPMRSAPPHTGTVQTPSQSRWCVPMWKVEERIPVRVILVVPWLQLTQTC